MLGVEGKKCKKMQKFYIILKGKGGVETVRGREGAGGEGKPKGRERGEWQESSTPCFLQGAILIILYIMKE
jgi:hypothetical protein